MHLAIFETVGENKFEQIRLQRKKLQINNNVSWRRFKKHEFLFT